MALHPSEYVSRIKQLSTLKALRDIVKERCRRLASPDWAAAVLQQMGVSLASASANPATQFRLPPSIGEADLVPVRMALCLAAEGLPWPAFVTAASAFFRCEVHGPQQPAGLATRGMAVKFCFFLLPGNVWRSVSATVPHVQVPMRPSGLLATVTDVNPDGSSIRPWKPPSLCLTRQWADSLKNAQPPRPKSRSESEPPPPPPGYAPRRTPWPTRSATSRHLPPSLRQRHVSIDRASMSLTGRSPSPTPSDNRAPHRSGDEGRSVPRYYRYDRGADAASFTVPWDEYEVSYSQHDSQGGYRGPGGMCLPYALPQTSCCSQLLLTLAIAAVQASLRSRQQLCPADLHLRCQGAREALPVPPSVSLEDARLSVQDGCLASRIVCVHCGYVQHCEVPACASCSGCHFPQVPFLGDQVMSPGTATKLGRALGCDPRTLMEFPAPLLRTVLRQNKGFFGLPCQVCSISPSPWPMMWHLSLSTSWHWPTSGRYAQQWLQRMWGCC